MEYIKVTNENIEKSIYVVQFLITKIFKYLQKKHGCQNDLRMV